MDLFCFSYFFENAKITKQDRINGNNLSNGSPGRFPKYERTLNNPLEVLAGSIFPNV